MHLGIPEYRLPRDVLQAQIREILDLGPELRLNSGWADFSLEDLRRRVTKLYCSPLDCTAAATSIFRGMSSTAS